MRREEGRGFCLVQLGKLGNSVDVFFGRSCFLTDNNDNFTLIFKLHNHANKLEVNMLTFRTSFSYCCVCGVRMKESCYFTVKKQTNFLLDQTNKRSDEFLSFSPSKRERKLPEYAGRITQGRGIPPSMPPPRTFSPPSHI